MPSRSSLNVQGMDAYDFAQPENILRLLNKEFWDGVSAAKWQDRRDSLQNLKQLASAPRLAAGDYADVVRELRKVGIIVETVCIAVVVRLRLIGTASERAGCRVLMLA